MTHQLETVSAVKDFIFGGNAHFTIRSQKTETRYTYRIRKSSDANVWFVGVMTGSDNSSHYSYIGTIKPGMPFRATAKSKLLEDDPRVVAFNWAIGNINLMGRISPHLEFWHEGRCGCCGRRLTVPESIESGIGPECRKKIAA